VSTDGRAAVRIADLASPQYTDEVRAVLGMMSEMGRAVVLEPRALMDAAIDVTGLSDFGATDFIERLDVLCRALCEEAGLNDAGVLTQHTMLVGLLQNRLLIEDLVKRHPEILETEIVAPIVICGLPRTGTTHLHSLISSDPALRSLPYWESLEPVLGQSEREAVEAGEADPRLARTAQALEFLDAGMPYFKRMHEMTVDNVHEEIQLLAVDFSSMLFETIAPMRSWRDYYLSHDQRGSYAYMVKILKVLQWLRGGTRWVLKSPQHLEQFPVLLDTFPDATFVVTHRDPVAVTASMVTMLAYTARLSHDHVDVAGIGTYWADRLERMLDSCAAERDALPAAQSIDVRFAEFMSDDVAMVERVYAVAGQPFGDTVRQAMWAFMRQHPRGRHGSVVYDLDQFGLDAGERRKALSRYAERFGIPEET
jgi:Sulfotransferase family